MEATLESLVLHPDEHAVERNGKPIQLRKKEYQLLEFLARNKNKIMNRNTLLEYVWNYNVQTMTNTLEVHMSNLRRKIDGDYPTKILKTVYGLGYKLCDAPVSFMLSGGPAMPTVHAATVESAAISRPSNTSPRHQAGDLSSPPHPVPSSQP